MVDRIPISGTGPQVPPPGVLKWWYSCPPMANVGRNKELGYVQKEEEEEKARNEVLMRCCEMNTPSAFRSP
jgi:hypothetical protein